MGIKLGGQLDSKKEKVRNLGVAVRCDFPSGGAQLVVIISRQWTPTYQQPPCWPTSWLIFGRDAECHPDHSLALFEKVVLFAIPSSATNKEGTAST